MLRLAFDFIITWRETRTRPNAYAQPYASSKFLEILPPYLMSNLTPHCHL